MADLYTTVQKQVDEIIKYYQEAAADGEISLSDVFKLLTSGIASFVKLVELMKAYDGSEKKAVVVKAAQRLYDEVIAPLDIPGIPNFMENKIVDPLIGKAIPAVVSGLIDSLVGIFNKDDAWLPPSPEGPLSPDNPEAAPTPEPRLPDGWEAY